MMYVGLDVHKNVCYGTVMNEKGKVAKQAKFTNDLEGVEAFMEGARASPLFSTSDFVVNDETHIPGRHPNSD